MRHVEGKNIKERPCPSWSYEAYPHRVILLAPTSSTSIILTYSSFNFEKKK